MRSRWDWVLLPGVALVGVAEALDASVTWRLAALPLALVCIVALLRRRADPFGTAIALLAVYGLLALSMILAGVDGDYATRILALPVATYSLVRWSSGRDAAVGLGLALPVAIAISVASPSDGEDSVLGSVLFWVLPILLGALRRSRAALAEARLSEARLAERRRIARELHDSVAHHVSEIAIQAKVAAALLADDPDGATAAIHTVQKQASTTLDDMRRMVGALRDEPTLTEPLHPLGRLADIARLADHSRPGPVVDVEVGGELDGLAPSTEAGLFRLAQEAITNARRHAKRATRIDVRITGTPTEVALAVVDDGDPVVETARSGRGYGLIGMHERATLLGGTFEAGPGDRRGWSLQATLPKHGASR